MRRVIPVAVAAVALLATQLPSTSSALVAPEGVTADSARAAAAKPKVRTKYALNSAAYGTRVEGGSVPANSDDTAYNRIGCTNVANINRVNYVADQVIPGLGKAEGIRTRVWTVKNGDKVSSFSEHRIAKLTIGNADIGTIEIRGLSSLAEAFNDGGRFGTSVDNEIARIVLRAGGRDALSLPIPAPNRALTIPGLARIALGTANRRVTNQSAEMYANALDIRVLPLGTRARVAQTAARIQGGIRQGVFTGYSAGVEARALADNTKLGRTPLNLLPCRGSVKKIKNVAGVDLGEVGNLQGVYAANTAVNKDKVARGTVVGKVASASLLGGRVQVDGIVGVASVRRENGKLTRSSEGSTVLDVTINGRKYSFPALGKITIPGLVELQDRVVQRTENGLKVIGLRVTVLDGTGAVIDLGVAQIGIRPGAAALSKG